MKPLSTVAKFLCVAALMQCAVSAVQAQNIVVNGGFENNINFSPWTLNQPGGFSNVGTDPSFAHSGNNHANLAPAVGQTGTLSQTLTTTVGTSYTLSFWLANDSSVPTNSFSALFNGSLVFATSSPPFTSAGNYVQFTFTNLIATSTSTILQFQFRHDDDFWRLDDVSVTAATPEGGATLWLAAPVLAGLCLFHLRSVRRNG